MAQSASMTKYTLDCPDELWDEWKETVPRRLNLNDGLLKLIARATIQELESTTDPLTEDEEKAKEQAEAVLDR